MSDYIVKDTELTSVANAIRTKGGTNSQLVFPGGFVSAIGNISGGGGSSDFSTALVTVNQSGDPMGYYWDNCPMLDVENNLLKGDAYTETSKAVLTVPLYKGKCYWDLSPRGLQLSGNIEEFWEGLLITGDCTITIS